MKSFSWQGFATKENALAAFSRRYPILSLVVLFFYLLGIGHAADDLLHGLLGWPIRPGHDYGLALTLTLTFMLVRPIFPNILGEQRQAEKDILDQAGAIDRAAGDSGLKTN